MLDSTVPFRDVPCLRLSSAAVAGDHRWVAVGRAARDRAVWITGYFEAIVFNRGILVNQNIPTDLPPVMAESDKLKQVFLNLFITRFIEFHHHSLAQSCS